MSIITNANQSQESFAHRLRQLRVQKAMTQMELGRLTDVSQVYIGRLEKGSSQPTADVIKRLAHSLDVTSGYLLEGEGTSAGMRIEDIELSRRFNVFKSWAQGTRKS